MIAIKTKAQMYRMLLNGRFGNTAVAWNSIDEVEASGYRGEVSLRSRQVNNPVRMYHVPFTELRERVAALPGSQTANGLVFSQSPPDHQRSIQGEVTINHHGYWLEYTFSPLPMRQAFDVQRERTGGILAKAMLEHYLTPVDFDELQQLLNDYPDHIVEFSSFRVPVGTIPNRRCIFWEVRQY